MRKLLLASVRVFALGAVPAAQAQDASSTLQPPADSTSPQPVPPSDGTTTVTTTETVTIKPAMQSGSAATDMAQKDKPTKMTVQQKTTYQTWPAERQAEFNAWPIEYQTFYWTLAAEQQQGYWALTADQRGRMYKMTPAQQQLAWQSIAQQLNGQTPAIPPGQANPPGQGVPTAGVPNPQSANQAAQPAMPADEGYQGGPYKGALTPPPADAMSKDYPVCNRTVSDGCKNKGGK